MGERDELRATRSADGRARLRRSGGCAPRRPSRRRRGRGRARHPAPAGRPHRTRAVRPTPAPSPARGRAGRSRSRRSRRGRRARRAPRTRPGSSVRIWAIAAARSASLVRPCRRPQTSRPVPSRFVRMRTSPGLAPPLRRSRSGCAAPTTARPYFGSASRIVWPPARIPPASRTFAAAAVEDRRQCRRAGGPPGARPRPSRRGRGRPSRRRRTRHWRPRSRRTPPGRRRAAGRSRPCR